MFAKMCFGAVALAAATSASALPSLLGEGGRGLKGYSFDAWVREFNVTVAPSEYALRKEIFTLRLSEISAHNNDKTKAYKQGVNQFTAHTKEEFKHTLGSKRHLKEFSKDFKSLDQDLHAPVEGLPTSVDWRDEGVITAVKNQGGCGSCWAFASTETLESHIMIDAGELLTLSPQNLVSCSQNPDHCGGDGGCGGSIAELAYKFVMQNGIATEASYPYTSGDTGVTGTCKPTTAAATVGNFVKLQENNYTAVMVALATVGPLAVNVAAEPWMSYKGGVYDGCPTSDSIDIDHVVQLVGYGTDAVQGDYWTVRNSWGAAWGEDGYIRLARHSDKAYCGTDSTPLDGTGCTGGPSNVTVCGTCGVIYDVSYAVGGKIL